MSYLPKERLYNIIVSPIISEKSTRLSEAQKQFAFVVRKDANKLEIKRAVELMFNVKVQSVNVCNYSPRNCHFRQRPGEHAGYKKAYVTLLKDFDINFAEL